MKIKEEKFSVLIEHLDLQINHLRKVEQEYQPKIDKVCPPYQKSATNLVHYLALRGMDNRKLQKQLGNLGLSRLARAEAHIMASLMNAQFILKKLMGNEGLASRKSGLSIKKSRKLLTSHTKGLLGYRSKGRRVRIMVTLPTEAAHNFALVNELVKCGMNCARINCAHDGPEEWELMIQNVKRASAMQKRNIKITMDLGGPKIRTGKIKPGPRVRKFTPERNELGQILNPSEIVLVEELREDSTVRELPVPGDWLKKLNIGDKIEFTDTRNKKRIMKVVALTGDDVVAHCYDTSYIGEGTVLWPTRPDLPKAEVGHVPPHEHSLFLNIGDTLTLHKEDREGESALYDEEGTLIREAHISCTMKEVFNMVKVGEKIYFDDGKIAGVIEEILDGEIKVLVTQAKPMGSKLKADKGINLPESDLDISGLTEKDKRDLVFVAEHADVVNFSFVNSPQDVEELKQELEKLNALDALSIILKIETQKAFNNLPEILLSAMQTHFIGVMIARGDLAVEVGWDRIGVIQDEIIKICNSAHIPVVWATQVLENLAKKGLPSRSEITDATQSLKAECVMLNKGTHINKAILLLNKILSKSEVHHTKNERMMPVIERL